MLYERDTIVEYTGSRYRAVPMAIGEETAIFYNAGRFGPWREAFPKALAESLVQQYPDAYTIIGPVDKALYPEEPFDHILEFTGRDIHPKTITVGKYKIQFSTAYGDHGPWRNVMPKSLAYAYQAMNSRLWHVIGPVDQVLPPIAPEPVMPEPELTPGSIPRRPQPPTPQAGVPTMAAPPAMAVPPAAPPAATPQTVAQTPAATSPSIPAQETELPADVDEELLSDEGEELPADEDGTAGDTDEEAVEEEIIVGRGQVKPAGKGKATASKGGSKR